MKSLKEKLDNGIWLMEVVRWKEEPILAKSLDENKISSERGEHPYRIERELKRSMKPRHVNNLYDMIFGDTRI